MLVIKNKYGMWSTPCSTKNEKEDITYWMSVSFKKGNEPLSEKIKINPTNWWMKAYKTKDGTVLPSMFIMSWEDETPIKREEKKDDISIQPDELPFY